MNVLRLFLAALLLEPVLAANPPSLSIVRDGDQIAIAFNGRLEAAGEILGPWTEITNASGSYSQSSSGAQRFFRTRAEASSIFSGISILNWRITGPLQTNFNLAYAGTPDGIVPPNRQKPYFDAQVQVGTLQLPVTMRVRGNSSLQECSFPKLKLKVSKQNRTNTPFADAREIKIGTHCAEGGRGNIGRLRDERAAWREALAYETMQVLGFVSPRVRRAIIEYHDTGVPDDVGGEGWTISRHAFISEDIELVAERLGGRALKDEEIAALQKTPFAAQLLTDLQFLHALLGNWDFSLEAEGRGIWNTEVIELADKTLLPVASDFDLASWVTEIVRLSVPSGYHPELQDLQRQLRYTLEDIQARSGDEQFGAAVARFREHRAAIEAKVQAAEIDDGGRVNAIRHVNAFYDTLDALLTVRP